MSSNFSNKNKSVAIIGFGASGVLAFYNLVNNFQNNSEKLTIKIFDASPFAGKGIAYKTNNLNHLLNVPAGGMTAIPQDSKHFISWLKNNGFNYDELSFVPRKIYGLYLEHLTKNAYKIAAEKNIDYHFISKNIENIDLENDNFLIDGQPYNYCVLAIGMELQNHPKNFWNDDLNNYLHDKEIYILGAGLTAYDAIIALRDIGYKNNIFVHSRTGLIPLAHKYSEEIFPCPLLIEDANLPLSKIFGKFVRACKNAGDKWQNVFSAFRPLTVPFWKNLSDEKKSRFMKRCFRVWNVHRHRCPPQQFKIISDMMNSGQLKFTTDKIDLKSKNLINCAGFDPKHFCSLTKNIIAKNIATVDALGMGIIPLKNNFHILGGLNFGSLLETTAMPEIRVQALDAANEILKAN